MTGRTDVDSYLAALPPPSRAALEELRAAIASAAPDAVEIIGWGMPGFKQDGRWLATYSAFKDHYSLFPMSGRVIEECAKDLGSHVSGKGTIRFEFGEPLPVSLVKRVITARLREINASERR